MVSRLFEPLKFYCTFLQISFYLIDVALKIGLAVDWALYFCINQDITSALLQMRCVYLQGYFVKSEGKLSVQSYLTTCDKCVLWLSYVHLNLTGELPSQLYDPASQMSGKLVCKVGFIRR